MSSSEFKTSLEVEISLGNRQLANTSSFILTLIANTNSQITHCTPPCHCIAAVCVGFSTATAVLKGPAESGLRWRQRPRAGTDAELRRVVDKYTHSPTVALKAERAKSQGRSQGTSLTAEAQNDGGEL